MREGADGDPIDPSGRCNPLKTRGGRKPRGRIIDTHTHKKRREGRRSVNTQKRQPTVRNPLSLYTLLYQQHL
jgi:hypothetical protein